jgi:hypothetical protein
MMVRDHLVKGSQIAQRLFAAGINAAKSRLPFVKIFIIADSNNWISVDYKRIASRSLFSKSMVICRPFVTKAPPQAYRLEKDFKNAEYKGHNLYRLAIYNICVELEVLPARIDDKSEQHRAVIAKWFALCADCIDFFEPLVLRLRPEKVLISQGHNFDAAVVRALSCKYGFGLLALENTFNKNKIVWENISGITVNKNLAKNFYWKYRDFVSERTAAEYVKEYLEQIKELKVGEHQTPCATISKSDKKTVLFIGQVYTDSSVLFGINDFPCPVAIIEQLVDYCLANGYHLIVKLHPKEALGNDILDRPYDNLTYRKIAEQQGLLEKMASGCFVLDRGQYDTYSLIDSAEVCVTVNSQAGLEALIKGKDLIVCGQGYYSGLGLSLEALNRQGLLFALDQILTGEGSVFNQADIDKFLYIISEKYFLERSCEMVEWLLTKSL